VQSIASQTLRNAPSLSHSSDAIESRLIAVSQVHNVLTDRSWAHVALHDIVAQVPPRMALPELVTNAVKYGALSNGTGQIRIHWTLDGTSTPQGLHLTWEEADGPPVQSPVRRGFGTRLIERSLAQELAGEVRIEFSETGVVCSVDAPLVSKGERPLLALLRPKLEGSNPHRTGRSENSRNLGS
jgi:two-component sensor histidine kinase